MTTLIVENGSIVPNANSYISQANAITYWTNWGYTQAIGASSSVQIQALYSAAYALDRLFGRFYLGKVARHSPQPMLWPRQRYANEEVFINVQDSTGAGALIVARIIEGVLVNAWIVDGGANYTAPTLNVGAWPYAQNVNQAVLSATVSSGVITGITISNGGSGYPTPRSIIDTNGEDIAINEVPQSLLDAQCELANMAIISGSTALFPNENEERYLQQEINELGAGLNLRRQFFPKETTDIERYQGFRKVELILWNVMNREMVVTL
jgi:hypothetical protein